MAGTGAGAVDCLIFSRDRPAQLDLLLRSIERHAASVYERLTVLVRCSDPGYTGYSVLGYDHPHLCLLSEEDFERDVRGWLAGAGELVSFLVDDDVFYRDAERPPRLPWSYRGGDYDYPFSVDGNVYERERVAALLDGLVFSDPTRLEAAAHVRASELGWPPLEHGEPCLVGLPWNRVSPSSNMPHQAIDPAELNERYLSGERLVIPSGGPYPAHATIWPAWS